MDSGKIFLIVIQFQIEKKYFDPSKTPLRMYHWIEKAIWKSYQISELIWITTPQNSQWLLQF